MFPQTTKLQKQGKIPIDMFSHTVKWAKIAVDMFPHTNEWDLTFLLSTQATLKQFACSQNKISETSINEGFSEKEALIFILPFSVFLSVFSRIWKHLLPPPCGFTTPFTPPLFVVLYRLRRSTKIIKITDSII